MESQKSTKKATGPHLQSDGLKTCISLFTFAHPVLSRLIHFSSLGHIHVLPCTHKTIQVAQRFRTHYKLEFFLLFVSIDVIHNVA